MTSSPVTELVGRLPRYAVAPSASAWKVYDRARSAYLTKTFPNKRTCLAAVQRLNRGAKEEEI